MTKEEIRAVFERAQAWPDDRLEEAALCLLALERLGTGVYILSDEERADVPEGMAEAERGEFATDEEVEAVFNRFRR
jgi:hypothetical protein